MLTTAVKLHDDTLNQSDIKNSCTMDDFINDLENGIPYNPLRHPNKKMKKRKQLDALLKFRSLASKPTRLNNRLSHEALFSSEDEVFLFNKTSISTKIHSTRYRRCCSYTRHILSFCFVCIFMIVCVGLAYANIELKNEVQNLSLRVTDIEKRFSNFEINHILATIEQIKLRLNLIERWNVSFLYDRLQKLQKDFHQIQNIPSTETTMNDDNVDISSKLNSIEQKSTKFSEVADELDKLSQDAENQVNDKTKPFDKTLIEKMLEEERKLNAQQNRDELIRTIISLNETLYATTVKWYKKLKFLQNELKTLNQSQQIEELTLHFQALTNFVHNSSDKVSTIVTTVQSDLDKLRNQMDACKCSKESVRLKPSIVDSNQLQQSIITKPQTIDTLSTISATSTSTTLELIDSSKNSDHNATIDPVAQIVNQSPSMNN